MFVYVVMQFAVTFDLIKTIISVHHFYMNYRRFHSCNSKSRYVSFIAFNSCIWLLNSFSSSLVLGFFLRTSTFRVASRNFSIFQLLWISFYVVCTISWLLFLKVMCVGGCLSGRCFWVFCIHFSALYAGHILFPLHIFPNIVLSILVFSVLQCFFVCLYYSVLLVF